MSRVTLWAGLIVIFLAGALIGAVGTSLYYQYEDEQRWERGPAARQERIMNRLTQELALSASQQLELEPIVAHAHLEILRLRVHHQPDVDRILAQLQRRWLRTREYVQQAQDAQGRKE